MPTESRHIALDLPLRRTGGIHGKVIECADIASHGRHVFICKAASESGQQILLEGTCVFDAPQWRGTRVSAVQDVKTL